MPKRETVLAAEVEAQSGDQSYSGELCKKGDPDLRSDESDLESLEKGDPELHSAESAEESSALFDHERQNGTEEKGGAGRAVPNRLCWYCKSSEHWAKDCYLHPKNWPDWLKAQLFYAQYTQHPMPVVGPFSGSSQAWPPPQGSQPISAQNADGQGAGNGTGNSPRRGNGRKRRRRGSGGNSNQKLTVVEAEATSDGAEAAVDRPRGSLNT